MFGNSWLDPLSTKTSGKLFFLFFLFFLVFSRFFLVFEVFSNFFGFPTFWVSRPVDFFLFFFGFLNFFLVFPFSDSQYIWKIILSVSMAYVHTCRCMWHLDHLQHFRSSVWFPGALGQANCFSCASSWVIGNPVTIMLSILCFIRLSTVSFILLRWDASAMNREHDNTIVEQLGPKT